MLGLFLSAMAMTWPPPVTLFIMPVLLAVIIISYLHLRENSPMKGLADPLHTDHVDTTSLVEPISYTDLFMSELMMLDSTLGGLLLTIKNLMVLAEQERNRAAAAHDNLLQEALEVHGYDVGLPLDHQYDCCSDLKILCNTILLTLYLLFSAGPWWLLVASVRAALSSVDQACLLFCAPARSNGIALGCGSMFVLGMISASETPNECHFIVFSIITILGAWIGSIAKALIFAAIEFVHQDRNPDFEQLFWLQLLPPGQQLLSPHQCRYSQDSISSWFRDGQYITGQRQSQQYAICACFHEGELFTLNNRTLFSAVIHGIWPIRVTIVEKPSTWSSRFTSCLPWTSIRVRPSHRFHPMDVLRESLVIPAEAFPSNARQAEGHVVLEVNNIVNSRQPQSETLVNILRTRCPGFNIEEFEGDRSFARARIRIADEVVVRAVIKTVGRERRKRVTISEVSGTRVFLSPRD